LSEPLNIPFLTRPYRDLVLDYDRVYNLGITSFIGNLNLNHVTFEGLILSLLFIALVHIAIQSSVIENLDDLNYTYIVTNALRLLGVQFNSLSSLDSMPYYVLNQDYFDRLPQLLILIFRSSPIGSFVLQSGLAIPDYGPSDTLYLWIPLFLYSWHLYLTQFGFTIESVYSIYCTIDRHTREFLHFGTEGSI